MARLKASQLPPELVAAFVDALEAWTMVEHDHFMINQFLARPPSIDQAKEAFSELSPRDQRDQTSELVTNRVNDEAVRKVWDKLYSRIKRLAQKRNRITHGRWHQIELVTGSKTTGFEYLRLYEGRGAGISRPTTETETRTELGKTRFYEKELRDAEREFVALAKDLHRFIEPLIRSVSFTQIPR